MLDFISIKSSNEKENKTDVLICYFGNSKYEYNQCSVFTYDMLDIDFENNEGWGNCWKMWGDGRFSKKNRWIWDSGWQYVYYN